MTRAMSSNAELLALFDAHARVVIPYEPGVTVRRDGPLTIVEGGARGTVLYETLDGADVDALIARTQAAFAARGEGFEWKTYAHDAPADLPARLVAAGFVAEDVETVVVADAARIAAAPTAPLDGIVIRRVREPDDVRRVAVAKIHDVPEDVSDLVDSLCARAAANPDTLHVFAAEHAGTPISSAWVVLDPDRVFAGLWGGSTAPAYRGRGVYRALVAARAQLASQLGYRFLHVDALETSRPILERLGFTAITQTTPYVWTPTGTPTRPPG